LRATKKKNENVVVPAQVIEPDRLSAAE